MIKKSFWVEEKQARWVEKFSEKHGKTESDVLRGILEVVMENPTLKDYTP